MGFSLEFAIGFLVIVGLIVVSIGAAISVHGTQEANRRKAPCTAPRRTFRLAVEGLNGETQRDSQLSDLRVEEFVRNPVAGRGTTRLVDRRSYQHPQAPDHARRLADKANRRAARAS